MEEGDYIRINKGIVLVFVRVFFKRYCFAIRESWEMSHWLNACSNTAISLKGTFVNNSQHHINYWSSDLWKDCAYITIFIIRNQFWSSIVYRSIIHQLHREYSPSRNLFLAIISLRAAGSGCGGLPSPPGAPGGICEGPPCAGGAGYDGWRVGGGWRSDTTADMFQALTTTGQRSERFLYQRWARAEQETPGRWNPFRSLQRFDSIPPSFSGIQIEQAIYSSPPGSTPEAVLS